LTVHVVAALALTWLGATPSRCVDIRPVLFGSTGYLSGAMGPVWARRSVQLYDGIDRIADAEPSFGAFAGVLFTSSLPDGSGV
jgi:hypothetical protein